MWALSGRFRACSYTKKYQDIKLPWANESYLKGAKCLFAKTDLILYSQSFFPFYALNSSEIKLIWGCSRPGTALFQHAKSSIRKAYTKVWPGAAHSGWLPAPGYWIATDAGSVIKPFAGGHWFTWEGVHGVTKTLLPLQRGRHKMDCALRAMQGWLWGIKYGWCSKAN